MSDAGPATGRGAPDPPAEHAAVTTGPALLTPGSDPPEPRTGPGARATPDAPTDTDAVPGLGVLRPLIGLLANATVLTALLVYFGWRRAATQAEQLGITEAVLGMGTRDYVLRSVRPVLVLLVGIGVAGLAWVVLDRWLTGHVRSPSGGLRTGLARRWVLLLAVLGSAWAWLPVLVWLAGFVWPAQAFVLFPACIGVGVLLLVYVADLRRPRGTGGAAARRRVTVQRASGMVLGAVCLFWTAANYAEVEGVRLADRIAGDITALPGVVVHSESRLHLEGPGVEERELPGEEGDLRFRYAGLRLLERTGSSYYLVSDGWTTTYGVLSIVPDDAAGVRVDLVRDER